jgi:hypothetical protein
MVKKPENVFPNPPQAVDWNRFEQMVKACGWRLIPLSKPTHYAIEDASGNAVCFAAKHHSKGSKSKALLCYVKELTRAAQQAGKL